MKEITSTQVSFLEYNSTTQKYALLLTQTLSFTPSFSKEQHINLDIEHSAKTGYIIKRIDWVASSSVLSMSVVASRYIPPQPLVFNGPNNE